MRAPTIKSTANLACKKGDAPTAEQFNQLKSGIEDRRNSLGGSGVRQRVLPWGTIRNYDSAIGSFTPTIWAVSIFRSNQKLSLTIGRGLVNGVEPVIKGDNGDVPISGDADGKIPRLEFDSNVFGDNGQAVLCLKASLANSDNGEWMLNKVEPVVLKEFPKSGEPWTAYKLLGFLLNRGGAVTWQQMTFFNLGLGTIYNRRPGGIARYVWWAR